MMGNDDAAYSHRFSCVCVYVCASRYDTPPTTLAGNDDNDDSALPTREKPTSLLFQNHLIGFSSFILVPFARIAKFAVRVRNETAMLFFFRGIIIIIIMRSR